MLDPFGRRSFLNCLNCSTKVALNILHFVFVKVGEVYVGSRFLRISLQVPVHACGF